MQIPITRATPDRLPVLVEVVARAFMVEPAMRWPFGDSETDHLQRLRVAFGASGETFIRLGLTYEAANGVGCAVWVPPGSDAGARAGEESLETFHALCDDGGARFDRFWAWVESHHLDEPHWYLNLVAVDPAHQGHGLGAALVEVGLQQARETRAPAFLVAAQPRNVGYYERFGFRTVFDGDPPDGGPHCWFMRYDA
jgi:ribosomal protein S18 acetylase RimI-like enzyme